MLRKLLIKKRSIDKLSFFLKFCIDYSTKYDNLVIIINGGFNMPKKKERYSTLTQIINALLKDQWQLDDNKYQELKHAINGIHVSNVNDTVHSYLIKCLEIKQEIGELSTQIDKATTIDKVTEFTKEAQSINDRINKIDINEIKLGIETEETKTKINDLKKTFQSKIQKLKKNLDLRKKEIEKKQEEQSGSSTTNQDQSQIKETGAVPKKPRRRDEERCEQDFLKQREKKCNLRIDMRKKKERGDKKEEYYNDFKRDLTEYLKITDCQIIFSLFRDVKEVYNKKNNVPKTIHILEKNYKKFNEVLAEHIKAYYVIVILNKLLEEDCIAVDLEEYKKNCKNLDISKNARTCGDKISVYFKRMKDIILKYGVNVSEYLSLIPNVENIKDVENNLVEELPYLYDKSLIGLQQEEQLILNLNRGITFDDVQSGKVIYDELYDKVIFNDCCKGKKNTSELLKKIMKENGYKEKIDKILIEEFVKNELIKQSKSSPNTTVEAPSSSQNGACALVSCLRSEGKF